MKQSEKTSKFFEVIHGLLSTEEWRNFLQGFDDNELYSILNMNLAKNVDPVALMQDGIELAEKAGSQGERVFVFQTDKVHVYARFETETDLYTDLTEQFVAFKSARWTGGGPILPEDRA
jgi:hypothetical protein